MNRTRAIWIGVVVVSLASFAQAADQRETERRLEAVRAKVDCCYTTGLAWLENMGSKDSVAALRDSQKAWENYCALEVKFEMGEVPRDTADGKDLYRSILLRLTRERIESIEGFFEYKLCNSSEVRIRNGSELDFKNVIINDGKYGDIKRGETSIYKDLEVVFANAYVSLIAGSRSLKLQPIDNIGERPLCEGRFTFVLTLKDGELQSHVESDPK